MEPYVPSKLPLADVQWEPLIPLIGRANRALAHYEGVLYGVPNAELLLSPLTTQERRERSYDQKLWTAATG